MEMKSERKRKGKITLVSRRGPETSAEQRYKDRQVREATHERRAAENRPQQEVLAFSVEVGRMLRRPPSEDPKRWWRSVRLKARLEFKGSWKKPACWKTANRHYKESRPTREVHVWTR